MKIKLKILKALSLVIGFFLIITPQPSFAQNANTILILPFDVQADPEYDYLKPALLDMLFTRLSAPGRTLIIGKLEEQMGISQAETFTMADAIQIGQQKGADYIVSGSIILQANVISTKADLIGIAEQRPLIGFSQKGTQPGDIISQIDNFTAQVNADILNPSPFSNEQTSQSEIPDDIHQHPEKITIPEVPADKKAENKPTEIEESPSTFQPIDNR